MTEREKLITAIERAREQSEEFGIGFIVVKFKETDRILELLKEQEALPIVYQDNPYTGLPVAHCPKCGKFARQYNAVYEDETKFCPYCGQEVKWE